MALADDTTHKFLSLLSEKPMTLTEICAKLTRFEGDMFKFIRIYYLYSFDKFIFWSLEIQLKNQNLVQFKDAIKKNNKKDRWFMTF